MLRFARFAKYTRLACWSLSLVVQQGNRSVIMLMPGKMVSSIPMRNDATQFNPDMTQDRPMQPQKLMSSVFIVSRKRYQMAQIRATKFSRLRINEPASVERAAMPRSTAETANPAATRPAQVFQVQFSEPMILAPAYRMTVFHRNERMRVTITVSTIISVFPYDQRLL